LDPWVCQSLYRVALCVLTQSSGAFQFGANSIARDHPARFCAFAGQIGMPIVLVQINYRLGPFGFAASSDLATEGTDGNYGFVDQQNAFKWVQNHI
jgi:carboxylesterase type B